MAITRAMHFGARLLLLDEPTAALFVRETRNVLQSIGRARDHGLGVLYIDHNMSHVLPVADRIVLLELGRVVRASSTAARSPSRTAVSLPDALSSPVERSNCRRLDRNSLVPGARSFRLLTEKTLMTKIGLWLSIPEPLIVEAAARAQPDWVGIDLQHGAWDLGTAFRGIQLLDALGTPALVRISEQELELIPRVLDHGASGVVLAMASSAALVEEAVRRRATSPRACAASAVSATGCGRRPTTSPRSGRMSIP